MLSVFVKAAKEAGQILLEMQSNARVVARRETDDVTLQADLRAQEVIKAIIEVELGDVPIIAEDSDLPEEFPSSFITIDPLDGTIPYSRNSLDWGVNIGFVSEGRPRLGVIYLPASAQLLEVDVDSGCNLNGRKLEPKWDESENRFILGLDLHYATDPNFVREVLLPMIPEVKLTRSLGSTSALTVDFASGRTDAHLNQKGGGIWDIVTLGAVAQAQGCVISDFKAEERKWNHNFTEILVSRTPEISEKLLSVTRKL